MFGQPVGEKDIEIGPVGIGVLSRQNCKRTKRAKGKQYKSFCYYQTNTNPGASIYCVDYAGVQYINDNAHKKYPDDGVCNFYAQ